MNLLVSAAFGYLLGSVPFAVIVSRAFRLADPRSFGSGNPGATNVLRSGSKAAALLTLIGDAAKGWLAMFIAEKAGAGDPAIPARPAALIDLVTPGAATEYRLGYGNFYVITRYNRSSFYAAAVMDLAAVLRASK